MGGWLQTPVSSLHHCIHSAPLPCPPIFVWPLFGPVWPINGAPVLLPVAVMFAKWPPVKCGILHWHPFRIGLQKELFLVVSGYAILPPPCFFELDQHLNSGEKKNLGCLYSLPPSPSTQSSQRGAKWKTILFLKIKPQYMDMTMYWIIHEHG